MKNTKVIDMRTKEELIALPYSKEQAEKLIAHIMKFEAPESTADSFSFMFENVIRCIINASGADMEVVYGLIAKSSKISNNKERA